MSVVEINVSYLELVWSLWISGKLTDKQMMSVIWNSAVV